MDLADALVLFYCWSVSMARYASIANVGMFVVHPVVISRKLSKIDPQLLLDTVRKLASLLPHSDPLQKPPLHGRYSLSK